MSLNPNKDRKRKCISVAETLRGPSNSEWLKEATPSISASQPASSISRYNPPSQRRVRQRLIISPDLPRPEASIANEARKKCKVVMTPNNGKGARNRPKIQVYRRTDREPVGFPSIKEEEYDGLPFPDPSSKPTYHPHS